MRITNCLAAGVVVVLAACDALYVGSAATVVTTDKTITDHAISLISGKDCSTVRTEQGRSFCKEDEVNPEPNVYCFQTIGGIDCYREPVDPYDGRKEQVGRNLHNRTGQF